MPSPTTSWNLVRVFATYRTMNGSMMAGSYKVSLPVRVTSTTDDAIIPAGTYAQGNFSVAEGSPSIDVLVPATDDPDIAESGWQVQIEVTPANGTLEKFSLDIPVANRPVADGGNGLGINLRTVIVSSVLPASHPVYKAGVPGGVALLDVDGDVIDAAGVKVVGGGGGGTGVTDPEVVRDTIAAALVQGANIGIAADDVNDTITIGTSATVNSSDAALRDRATHTGTQSLDTTTDSATRLALAPAERTKIAGVATGATANATDAALRDRATHTGTQSLDTTVDSGTRVAMTPAERTKLSGVATGATANATDAALRDRSTHTGTQTSATISDFVEAVQDALSTFFNATGATFTYDDANNQMVVNVPTGTGGTTDPEVVRDTIGAALIGVGVVSVAVNDAADTITISSTATANSTDAALRDRSTHTGTQSADTLTDGTTNKAFLATERTKLAGVATGATANATDAALRDRSTHTGSQAASTISDSTTTGRAVLTAASAAAARTAIGAGTSSLAVGTTAADAKAGNYTPPIADLPAGSTLYTSGTTRPTARTDIMVIFTGADPGSNALTGDIWTS